MFCINTLRGGDAEGAQSEVCLQLRYGAQVSWSYLMKKSLDMVSLSYVGHLGKMYMSATGLALVTANVTGNSFLLGLGGALSTLCSQASGAGDLDTLNIVFQRSLIISLLTCIPICTLWLFSEPVLSYLGQDQEIAYHAAKFLFYLIPGICFFSQSLCIQNWLFSQHKMTAPTIIISIVAIGHVWWNYLFVTYLQMGFIGTALAISTSRLLELIMLVFYIQKSNSLIETEFAWSWRCFNGWLPFFSLFYGNIMMMSELWASEILTFLSGTLSSPHVEIAAMSIYQSMNAFFFQFSNGIQRVACTRVGNLLGSGQAKMARNASSTAASITFVLTLCISLSLVLFSRFYVQIYTNDKEVIEVTVKLVPILALYVIGDGTVAALSGVIKGIGKQIIGGRIVVFSYYVIAIPISVLLTYHWGGSLDFGMGIVGLCLGTLVGTYTHCILYFIYIFAVTNWDHEVALAQERLDTNKDLVGSRHHNIMHKVPTRIASEYDSDADYDRRDRPFLLRLFNVISVFFGSFPFLGAASEESIRKGEYELVQAYTADLENSEVTLNDDDEDECVFS